MTGRRIVVVIAIAGVLVCACGSADDASVPAGSGGHGSGADTGTVTASGLPPGQVVFAVSAGAGGLAPVPRAAYDARSPRLAVFGDGRVVWRADGALPWHEVFSPGAYRVGQADPDEVARFVEDLHAQHVLDPEADVGRPPVTDLFTTTVTVHGHYAAESLDIYAFDERFEDSLTDRQRTARRSVREAIAAARGFTGDGEAYVPDRVSVSRPYMVDTAVHAEDLPVWPGPDPSEILRPPADGPERGTVDGDDAAALYSAALENPPALWNVDGTVQLLVVDPVPEPGGG